MKSIKKSWANVFLAFFFFFFLIPGHQNGFILWVIWVILFYFFNSRMSYVRLKGFHFFRLTLLQGAPCLEVMGCDTGSIAGPGMLKMLIDLKVTNEIHSSEFANSHNMPPNPMETTGRH